MAAIASRKRAGAAGKKQRAQRQTSNVFAMFEQSQIHEFKEAFNMIDTNKDGFITAEDLREIYGNLGKEVGSCFFLGGGGRGTSGKRVVFCSLLKNLISVDRFIQYFKIQIDSSFGALKSVVSGHFRTFSRWITVTIFNPQRDQKYKFSLSKLLTRIGVLGSRLIFGRNVGWSQWSSNEFHHVLDSVRRETPRDGSRTRHQKRLCLLWRRWLVVSSVVQFNSIVKRKFGATVGNFEVPAGLDGKFVQCNTWPIELHSHFRWRT